ncbi:MAG: hypothetical protein AAGA65_09570 [Actinomycetota bacterium]
MATLGAACATDEPSASVELAPTATTNTDGDRSSVPSQTSPTTEAPEASQTSTTATETVNDLTDGRFDDSLISVDDFSPEGESAQITDETAERILFLDEVCRGVRDVSLTTAPLVEVRSGVFRSHIYYARALSYANEAAALDAFDQAHERFVDCDGGIASEPRSYGPVLEVWVDAKPIDASPVAGAVRSTAVQLTHTHMQSVLDYELRLAVVGATLIMLGTTDPELAGEVADLVAARVAGAPPPGPFEPTGELVFVPGYGSEDYWSDPEAGPEAVRALLPTLAPDVAAWVEGADDERIDEKASGVCGSIFGMMLYEDFPDWYERSIGDGFNWFERDAHSRETLVEIFAMLSEVYCPGGWDQLQAMIPRA